MSGLELTKLPWRATTLGALCAEGGGGVQTGPFGSQLHASDYVAHGIPSVMPQNIGDNIISADGIARITEADATRLTKYRVREGDIVYSRRGDVEKRALIRQENDGWLCGTGCLRVRLGDNSANDPRFISYALGTENSRAWIKRHAVGATMPNLNTSILAAVPLQVPSYSEQRAIAEVLGALDDKIATNIKLAYAAESLLAAEFTAMRIDEESENSEASIPLRDLVELNPAVSRPSEEEPVYVDMQKLPISGMSITDWTTRPVRGGARFENGDTLLARITPCLQNRKTGYVDFLSKGQVAIGSTEYIIMRSRPHIPAEFSYFLAISERFRSFAIRHMVGTSGRQRVSASDLAYFQVKSPEPALLSVFGCKSGGLFALIRSQRDENRALSLMRDALLPQLMSGKIRVKDAEKTVEEVL